MIEIKLRAGILLAAGIVASNEIICGEKSDVPPHTHQESEVRQGPSVHALSFAKNGGITTTIQATTIRSN
jgi:hypothetical protein